MNFKGLIDQYEEQRCSIMKKVLLKKRFFYATRILGILPVIICIALFLYDPETFDISVPFSAIASFLIIKKSHDKVKEYVSFEKSYITSLNNDIHKMVFLPALKYSLHNAESEISMPDKSQFLSLLYYNRKKSINSWSNNFCGIYKDKPFEYAEYKRVTTHKDHESTTDFNGAVITMKSPFKTTTPIFVSSSSLCGTNWNCYKQIKSLDHNKFKQSFVVYSEDIKDAFSFLTPVRMNKIVEKHNSKEICGFALVDEYIFVVVNKKIPCIDELGFATSKRPIDSQKILERVEFAAEQILSLVDSVNIF